MSNENAYTVCMLFNHDLSNMLLIRKNQTDFKNMLNGPGGAIENNEHPYYGALREIQEETGLNIEDLEYLARQDTRLIPLGILRIPYDCKAHGNASCSLHYFAGIILENAEGNIKPGQEALTWMPYDTIIRSGVDSPVFAGNGDLPYFARAGFQALRQYVPDAGQGRKHENPVYGTENQDLCDRLIRQLNRARGDMSACFRRYEYDNASREASKIARMSYAIAVLRSQNLGIDPGEFIKRDGQDHGENIERGEENVQRQDPGNHETGHGRVTD